MVVVKTLVAKSHNIHDAALNLNAKAYEVRHTLAATWDLKPTSTKPPPPEESFSLDMKNESSESVVGDEDGRTKVGDEHFAPGGKYRSVVKLFMHYEFQKPNSWAMGTGWLISPDILVTAGHCSYDWSHKLGRATEVKAYIGYKGHQSEKDPNVQFRHVKRIVTTEGWVKTKGQKCFDVSFMQVDRPFQGITPIKFAETPATGNVELGVVGYPGDLSDKQTGEHGAAMYEMFLKTEWDLSQQADTMLEYQIDTFGGNSGSPVFRRPDLASIGAHVYGGTFNSASVIGKYGNPYDDYLAAFNLPVPNDGLNLIPVTGNSSINAPVPSGFVGQYRHLGASRGAAEAADPEDIHNADLFPNRRAPGAPGHAGAPAHPAPATALPPARPLAQRAPVSSSRLPHNTSHMGQLDHHLSDEEGFFDVLKKAASVGAPLLGHALNTALPIAFGPIGGRVGALAGFALNAAGKACESIEVGGTESVLESGPAQPGSIPHEGTIERAILAEAVLTTLQSTELSHHTEESIFTDMKDTVMKALPTVRKVAPHILGSMMEPALRIALDSLHNYNAKGSGGAEAFEDTPHQDFFRPPVYTQVIDRPVDRHSEEFLKHLHTSMKKHAKESAMDGESTESFIDVLKAGVRLAGKGLSAAAKTGLPILVNAIASQAGGAEAFEAGPSDEQPHAFSADALAHRAIVAEAALQAVMKQDPQYLQEEGFFDFVSKAVKTIAPVAIKMAPVVASAINPTVGKIVKGALGQESTIADEYTPGRHRRRAEAPRLRSQRSLATLRAEGVGQPRQASDYALSVY